MIAKRNGASLVIINLTETPHDHLADVVINEMDGEVLSSVIKKAKEKLAK